MTDWLLLWMSKSIMDRRGRGMSACDWSHGWCAIRILLLMTTAQPCEAAVIWAASFPSDLHLLVDLLSLNLLDLVHLIVELVPLLLFSLLKDFISSLDSRFGSHIIKKFSIKELWLILGLRLKVRSKGIVLKVLTVLHCRIWILRRFGFLLIIGG